MEESSNTEPVVKKCCSCSRPATHGVRCEIHYLREKERYQAKKDGPKCVRCKKADKEPGYQMCRPCLDKENTKAKEAKAEKQASVESGIQIEKLVKSPPVKKSVLDKERYDSNVAAGYCSTGGPSHARPEGKHKQCNACLASKRARHNDKKLAGICVEPGCTNPAAENRVRCTTHLAEKNNKRQANIDAGLCACGKKPLPGIKACAKCQKNDCKKGKTQRDTLRDDVFEAYGGYACSCPGCTQIDPLFLSIDHINNDGAAHRKQIQKEMGYACRIGSNQFYRWLQKHKCPPGFQVYCMNCNMGKHRNGGVCPRTGTQH